MGLKVLPQFIEELDSAYTREDSKYFLGFDKIDDFPSILKYIDKLTLEESVLFSSYMESAEIVYAWMGPCCTTKKNLNSPHQPDH